MLRMIRLKNTFIGVILQFFITPLFSLAHAEAVGNIYFSQPDASGLMTIRAIEWQAAATSDVINRCQSNKDPAKETCWVEISCLTSSGINTNGEYVLGHKYRMTMFDLRDMVLRIVGTKMLYTGCYKYNGRKYVLSHSPYIYVGPLSLSGGDSSNVNLYFFDKVVMPKESPNLTCNATTQDTDIDFGDIEYNTVNGASKSININIGCQNGDGFAHISSVGYARSSGLLLRSDGSLNAEVEFNDIPADIPISYFIEENTSRDLVVKATLRSTPSLKGGVFSGSLVIKITYD